MGALSPVHLLLILGIALIVLGPKRLPEAGEALGHALREFRDAVSADETRVTAATPTPATVSGVHATTDEGDIAQS